MKHVAERTSRDGACPVCGNGSPVAIDRRRRVPTVQNVVFADSDSARGCPTGTLDMQGCPVCGFVWNAAFESALIAYDARYDNDVFRSTYYMAHLRETADRVLAALPQHVPLNIVEIGCGQGDFLALLRDVGGARVRSLVGYDPAWRGCAADGAALDIRARYFTADEIGALPAETNVVICRHAIEYFSSPGDLIASLAPVLRHDEARLFIETPSVDWILDRVAFEDLNYERCSLFSSDALRAVLAAHALLPRTIRTVYGGQYLWVEATRAPTVGPPEKMLPNPDRFRRYTTGREALIGHWTEHLERLNRVGPVALWGAAAKGVTFAQLMAEEGGILACAIDLNEAKQGSFMAMTGLPIVSPENARKSGVRSAVVMNRNYLAEIGERCRAMGWDVTLLPLHDGGA